MRNDNHKIIQRLSQRSLKNNRLRNLVAVIAIALTSMLFTAVFSMGSGMVQVAQEKTMHEVGMRCHGALKAVTREQMEAIVQNEAIRDYSYNIYIGSVDNIRKRHGELRFTPMSRELENTFITLKAGRMPEAPDDIIADTAILDEMKKPYEIGVQLTLEFHFHGKPVQHTFTVCGWYDTDYVNHASQLYVSEAYWDSLKGGLSDGDFAEWGRAHPEDASVGLYAVGLYFTNSGDIENKLTGAIRQAGYEPGTQVAYGVNWAFMSNRLESVDAVSMVILGSAFLVILITGYLIIYNIFHISIMQDIRFYGLLKTIGTTKRQIRHLIRRQALILSIVGIPVGLLAGFGVGKVMFPLMSRVNDHKGMEISLQFHPLIFVFGAVFSFMTVLISCRKPGRIAGNVSPIEALRYTDGTGRVKKQKRSSRGARPVRMALSNLGRNKKKTVLVVCSMALSIVLLTIVMTAVSSFRLDRYLDARIIGDFVVANQNFMSSSGGDLTIDENYISQVDALDGISAKNEIWKGKINGSCLPDDAARAAHKAMNDRGILFPYDSSGRSPQQIDEPDFTVGVEYYGYTQALLSKLEVLEGTLDPEKFARGDYILITRLNTKDGHEHSDSLYKPGHKLKLALVTDASEYTPAYLDTGEETTGTWSNMAEKEYEVMAVVELPGSMEKQGYSPNGFKAVLPLADMKSAGNRDQLAAVSYNVNEESRAAFEAFLKDYTDKVNTDMGYVSRTTLEKEFSVMTDTVWMVGGAMCAIIALIGILNFINAMLTGMIARRREFAVMKSVGMTKMQLSRMLICEGVYYGVFSGILGLLLGIPLARLTIRAFSNVLMFFEYRFTPLSFVIMIPIFLAVGVIVPWVAYNRSGGRSIVEQLKAAE